MKKTIILLVALTFVFAMSSLAAAQTSKPFSGGKVNGGTVTHSDEGNMHVLTLSNDFQQKIDAPDPHWRVVDSKGNIFMFQRFEIKDMKYNRKIMVPKYVSDIAKVQFWCAFAETVLGEAPFEKPVK